MNCCNDYGKCTQGKDCPVRITRSLDAEPVTHTEAVTLYLVILVGCVILVALMLSVVAFSMS